MQSTHSNHNLAASLLTAEFKVSTNTNGSICPFVRNGSFTNSSRCQDGSSLRWKDPFNVLPLACNTVQNQNCSRSFSPISDEGDDLLQIDIDIFSITEIGERPQFHGVFGSFSDSDCALETSARRCLSCSEESEEENERFFLETLPQCVLSNQKQWSNNLEVEVSFRNPQVIGQFHIKAGEYLFKIGDVIGNGTFGTVYDLNAINCELKLAVKTIQRGAGVIPEQMALKELEILEFMRSKHGSNNHIALLLFGCITESKIYLVFEKYDLSLRDHLDLYWKEKPMPLIAIKIFSKQLLRSLEFMHSLGFAHTDIKPENIMLVGKHHYPLNIKLIDFGCAVYIDDLISHIGIPYQTLPYRGPEVILGSTMNEKMDIWSVAVLLAEMYIGCMIFPARTDFEIMKMIYDTFPIPFSFLVGCLRYSYYFELSDDILRSDVSNLKKVSDIPTESFTSDDMLHVASFTRYVKHFDDIIKIGFNSLNSGMVTFEDNTFMDFLACTKKIDPGERFSANEALSHAWLL